ncbi:MAG: hypothetical protein ACTSPM_00670 [Candidatus Heimdallarchaeota archaeon]
MNKAIYYKYLFIVAGFWNIGAALVFGIFAPLISGFLPFFGMSTLTNEIYFWMYGFLILAGLSGFRYFLVGLDITKNHLVVSSGLIAKFIIFTLTLVFFIMGTIAWPLLVMGIINLIFCGLFIEFYVNYKKLLASDIGGAYSYRKNS